MCSGGDCPLLLFHFMILSLHWEAVEIVPYCFSL